MVGFQKSNLKSDDFCAKVPTEIKKSQIVEKKLFYRLKNQKIYVKIKEIII